MLGVFGAVAPAIVRFFSFLATTRSLSIWNHPFLQQFCVRVCVCRPLHLSLYVNQH